MFSLLLQTAEFTPGTLRICLSALTAINVLEIQRYRLPPLYRAGMVYKRQAGCYGPRDKNGNPTKVCTVPGVVKDGDPVLFREQWRTAYVAYNEMPREADCKVLAPWRTAELQIAGERAIAFARIRRIYDEEKKRWKNLAHILVQRGDGTIEDPSRLLGMGREDQE
jgi:hypothetical protein